MKHHFLSQKINIRSFPINLDTGNSMRCTKNAEILQNELPQNLRNDEFENIFFYAGISYQKPWPAELLAIHRWKALQVVAPLHF